MDISRITPSSPQPAPTVVDERGPPPGTPSGTRRSATFEAPATASGGGFGKSTARAATIVPSHPSRIWVQVATGRDRAALAFDWGRIADQAPGLFRSRKGWITPWGEINRLLVGPFESQAAAQVFVNELGSEGVAGFLWTSAAGQPVDPLSAR